MQPIEVLDRWASVCEQQNIRWYLYRETLLCAHGYHALPDMLDYAQVAVFAEDLPAIMQTILPRFFPEWTCDVVQFTVGAHCIHIQENGSIVLSLDVLSSTDSQDNSADSVKNIKEQRARYGRKGKYLRFAGKILCKFLHKNMKKRKLPKKAFPQILSMVGSCRCDGAFYSDSLTSKDAVLLEKELFGKTGMLACENREYPVFEGYRTYLEAVFGDYERGLEDEIGVGLTVQDKEELREHQKHCKEALDFLKNLGEEFGLRYYLLAGSVLGPVREGGFIPWDDDIDVGIRIEDLKEFEEKVAEYLPERLPEEFVLMQSGPDNPFPRMFSKICWQGRCCIDLWPLVPTYENGFRAIWQWYFGKMITKIHYDKIGHDVKKFKKIVRLISPFMTDRMTMWLARRNERKYIKRQTPVYINLYSIYKRSKETIKREWLDHPEILDFDGIKVPGVGSSRQYMEHLYGDYMKRPAPWKRASRHFERFFK